MSQSAASPLEPGSWVRHPGRPDWGPGQVQSAIGSRVTVNFENAAKVLINTVFVALEPTDGPGDAPEDAPEDAPGS